MAPKMDDFLQPCLCYKVQQLGPPLRESREDSLRFFNNEELMHVVIQLDSGLHTVMNPWFGAMNTLKPSTWYQYRVVNWSQQVWLILSMYQVEIYSLAVHVEEGGHELALDRYEHENVAGHLELFPFYGPTFRIVRPNVPQLTKS